MPPFLANFSQLPGRSKAILGATAVGILLLIFFMLRIAGAPSYATLSSGLDPAQTGKLTAALDEQGIGYELQANGTALAVEKADVAKARIALAGAGVTGGAGNAPGFEILKDQKLGASDFQNRALYQMALEGEITNAVSAVSGVTDPKVQLVLPEDDLFVDESSPATASVALGNAGDTLEPGAARGIAQLVSSSVKGLKPASVTITDVSGQILWPAGEGDGAGGGAAGSAKAAAEGRYARSMESRINAMLDRTLGPGKAVVQVQADLNMDKTTKNQLVYAKRGVPLKAQEETERLRGSGAGRAGGAAGTGSNIPSYSSGGAGGGGDSNYQRKAGTTEFGVDKTVSKTDVAQGAVNKLQVSLLLDKSVAAAGAQAGNAKGVQAIQDSVAAAAGLDTARGDTITATELAFAKPPTAKPQTGPLPAGSLAQAKWAALGLGTLIFLFFMWRHLRRRERDALPQPEWLSQIDQPVSLAALEAGETAELEPLPERETEPGLLRLEQLMEREPEKVAAQVRQWMTEE
ncbi:MAG TPA: flagellar basal-body MS-ring/collar protein FliF [Solirubrobacteraceae bacterium]|jgi:flagellar M-ring protein FliF